MYDTDEIRALIDRSLDRKVYLRSLAGLLLAIPLAISYSHIRHPDLRLRTLLSMALVFIPFALIWGLRLLRLYRNLGGYIIVRAVLGESKQWYNKSATSLPVYIGESMWGPVTARTNRIFYRRGFSQPQLSDYENRTVTVAYNRMTDTVVVLEQSKNVPLESEINNWR